MRVGLSVASFAAPGGPAKLGAVIVELARRAEAAGFESFWVWDHFFWDESPIGPGVTDRAMLEAYTILSFVAGVTSTIKLGTMVASATYRHPGVLVKQVTGLDVLSGGRAIFGIGAGWFEEEHRGLGIPFPNRAERFERLEETVQIALQMWSDEGKYDRAKPFRGQHYQLERTLNVPQTLQRPHPPILIGGGGERKTLRLVAQYADACNLHDTLTSDQLSHKLAVLRGHCERLGRRYEAIEKTVNGARHATPDRAASVPRAIDYCRGLADLGIDTVILAAERVNIYEPAVLDLWAAELLPALHALPVAGRGRT
ncbi:MAG TPA: LLM class F420-dependent oxidoreductase [bacterium]|nr:LLM class F420-dependent oxidoreductase [bacterium]